MIDLKSLTIKKAHEALMKSDFSAVDLAKAYLENIEKKNKELNAYLEVFGDVLGQAKEADKMIKEGKVTLLTGIPIAVKDNFLIKGRKASSASKILENYVATYDGTAIKKLKEAGVVFLGRTNMDEFAMGASTETSAYGITRNPHDVSRVPGGSSGGSAVAVSADLALFALGSDTGGSVRQPSAFCGVVGLKPTYGAISRHGLMAMASSLDHVGVIAKSVEDAEIVFDYVKGKDIMDSTSLELTTDNLQPARTIGIVHSGELTTTRKLTVGVPTAFTESEGVDKEVIVNFKESIKSLKDRGYQIKEISLPNIKYSVPSYYVIVPAEVSANLARYDGVKFGLHKEGKNLLEDYFLTRGEGFGKEVRRRIILGTYVLSSGYYDAYYNKANQARDLIKADFRKAFEGVDIIAMPSVPTPAFKIGEKIDDPLQMYLADIFTAPADLAGIPAISVPSGFVDKDGKNLPLSIQFLATEKGENNLFNIAKDFNENISIK